MADVTDPEAIKFVNEVVRPLAERLRGLKYAVDNAVSEWDNGISAKIIGGDNVVDGREAQGVSRLTATDVTNLITRAQAVQDTMDEVGEVNVVLKPCVRTYRSE